MSLERAFFTASVMALDSRRPPKLKLMTWAPFSTAYRMPLAMPAVVGAELLPGATFTAKILQLAPTPATPTPLWVIAAAIPATWVP